MFNALLPLVGLFSTKLSLFVNGRKDVFGQIENFLSVEDRVLWMHCASLGEYEQGVPVLEALKKNFPNHKLLVTFFSPSGYEIKKNSSLADVVAYLPMDTKSNARRFIKLINPELALFVKYEFWPNYLKELETHKIPTILISAVFRKEQAFFRWYGGFMRNALQKVDHFFVQDSISKQLITEAGYENVTISGDTRFDRVSRQIEMNNSVGFLDEFIGGRLCIVFGSSWAEDEALFIDFVNKASTDICFIIAPHEIKDAGVEQLKKKLSKPTIPFSEKDGKSLIDYQVFILNTIGYLSRAYSYADIAYVGGAMGTSGLHNILEPATFGIPIIIGKNFEKFREARQLQKLAGLFSVSTAEEFTTIIEKLIENDKFRQQTGMIAGHFVNSNTGATQIIMKYLTTMMDKK